MSRCMQSFLVVYMTCCISFNNAEGLSNVAAIIRATCEGDSCAASDAHDEASLMQVSLKQKAELQATSLTSSQLSMDAPTKDALKIDALTDAVGPGKVKADAEEKGPHLDEQAQPNTDSGSGRGKMTSATEGKRSLLEEDTNFTSLAFQDEQLWESFGKYWFRLKNRWGAYLAYASPLDELFLYGKKNPETGKVYEAKDQYWTMEFENTWPNCETPEEPDCQGETRCDYKGWPQSKSNIRPDKQLFFLKNRLPRPKKHPDWNPFGSHVKRSCWCPNPQINFNYLAYQPGDFGGYPGMQEWPCLNRWMDLQGYSGGKGAKDLWQIETFSNSTLEQKGQFWIKLLNNYQDRIETIFDPKAKKYVLKYYHCFLSSSEWDERAFFKWDDSDSHWWQVVDFRTKTDGEY